jgi:hypothetical protein
MNRDEFAQHLLDELQLALDEDRLTEDQIEAITAILKPAAERAKHRAEHGGPSAAEIEKN